MRNEVIISGYGGQGILFAGMFLSRTAIVLGFETTFFPSYGAEIRGGSANCSVILSDSEIGSPVVSCPDYCLLLSQPAFKKYSRAGGRTVYITNSTIVEPGNFAGKLLPVPASALAKELGDIKTANMIMLGAYISLSGLTSAERLPEIASEVLAGRPENVIHANIEALRRGFAASVSKGNK